MQGLGPVIRCLSKLRNSSASPVVVQKRWLRVRVGEGQDRNCSKRPCGLHSKFPLRSVNEECDTNLSRMRWTYKRPGLLVQLTAQNGSVA
jgi:hypothetical protein